MQIFALIRYFNAILIINLIIIRHKMLKDNMTPSMHN